jgi:2-iminoacetate synthase
MSYLATVERYEQFDFDAFFAGVTADDVARALGRETLSERDYLVLLSPAATAFLEPMAQRANALTRQHFGNAVSLFTPLYVSNYCTNHCAYCSFAATHRIHRRHLTMAEVEAEAERIAAAGLRHLLLLTGDAPRKASLFYLEQCARLLQRCFSTLGIEIYSLTEDGYARLIAAGVDSLTLFQETYDRALYATLHGGGPKADFAFRLDSQERACRVGIRSASVGALLGLAEPRRDAFLTGLHARYLQDSFPAVEIASSFPRLRPFAGAYQPRFEVPDRLFVQLIVAFRLFLPRAGITISTRERAAFRDRLVPLGATRLSAGVSTAVGGHGEDPSTAQFEIADPRSADELAADLARLGYQLVRHDWNHRYLEPAAHG